MLVSYFFKTIRLNRYRLIKRIDEHPRALQLHGCVSLYALLVQRYSSAALVVRKSSFYITLLEHGKQLSRQSIVSVSK